MPDAPASLRAWFEGGIAFYLCGLRFPPEAASAAMNAVA